MPPQPTTADTAWAVQFRGWVDAVAAVAERIGVHEAERIFGGAFLDGEGDGLWFDRRAYNDPDDYPQFYLIDDRELQWERLHGLGQPPDAEECTALEWPQRDWWGDRDRIVLMHELLQMLLPDDDEHAYHNSRRFILDEVRFHANSLWGGPAGTDLYDNRLRMYTMEGQLAACPGWRYLGMALKGCPKELRLPLGPELLRRRASQRVADADLLAGREPPPHTWLPVVQAGVSPPGQPACYRWWSELSATEREAAFALGCERADWWDDGLDYAQLDAEWADLTAAQRAAAADLGHSASSCGGLA